MRVILLIFIFLFSCALLFLNWGALQDIFNYKTIYGNAFQTFKETHLRNAAKTVRVPETNLVPTAEAETEQNKVLPPPTAQNDQPPATNYQQTTKLDALLIPGLGVSAPLLMAESSREDYMQKLLKKGVVAFPGSTMSNGGGVAIILGHSAPPGWPKRNYDWVFSDLNDLENGDEIIIMLNGRILRYAVTKKFFLKKGQEIPIENSSASSSTIILLTCWPPGVDYQRIAVQAELKP